MHLASRPLMMRDGAAEPHTLVDHGTQIGSGNGRCGSLDTKVPRKVLKSSPWGSQILLLPQSFSDGLFFLPFRNVALVRKGSHRAAELLNETSTIELGTPNSYVVVVPVYLRG